MSEREPSDDNSIHNSNKECIRDETFWHANSPRLPFELFHIVRKGQRLSKAERKLPWRHLTSKFLDCFPE